MCKSADSIIRDLYYLHCKRSGEKLDKIYITKIDIATYRVQKDTDGMETFIPRRLIDVFQCIDDENSEKIISCFKNFRNVTD